MKEKQVIYGNENLALAPIKYEYAWQFYENGKKNFWIPQEIAVAEDVASFKHDLNDTQRHIFTHVFAQLSTMDIAAGDFVNHLAIELTSPEHKIALSTQAFQEATHSESYKYCADHIGLDERWLWNRWEEVPEIKAKIDMTSEILGQYTATGDPMEFINAYFFLAGIFESTWFLTGFFPIFALANMGKVLRVSEVLQYIARDEYNHVSLGLNTITSIIQEQFDPDDTSMIAEDFSALANRAMKLEEDYINFIFSKGEIIGYSPKKHMQFAWFRIFHAFNKLKLTTEHLDCNVTPEAVSWADTMLNTRKLKNFFESRVIEYMKTHLDYTEELETSNYGYWDDPINPKDFGSLADVGTKAEKIEGKICSLEEGCEVCQ